VNTALKFRADSASSRSAAADAATSAHRINSASILARVSTVTREVPRREVMDRKARRIVNASIIIGAGRPLPRS